MDAVAGAHAARYALAGDQGFVNFAAALHDLTVGGNSFAAGDQDPHAGNEVLGFDDPGAAVSVDDSRADGPQAHEVLGSANGAGAHAFVERAADQQEEDQRDRGVEVDVLGAANRLPEAHGCRQDNAERDRHVHVEAPTGQRLARRIEERLRRIGRRRHRDQRRQPVEQVARGRVHVVGGVTRPDRHRQQHNVGGGEAGDAEPRHVVGDTRCLRSVRIVEQFGDLVALLTDAAENGLDVGHGLVVGDGKPARR